VVSAVVALLRFTNILQILVMAEFWKSVSIWWGYVQENSDSFCVLVFCAALSYAVSLQPSYVNGRRRPFTFNHNIACVPAVIVALP